MSEGEGAYELEFTIPELPPTTNSHGRIHWSIKAKIAKKWRYLVFLTVGHKRPKAPLNKASLELIRVSSGTCDADGLVSSFKHVIDGLIDAGVIVNDSMKHIGFPKYQAEKGSPGKGYIRVIVREIKEET